MSRKSFGNDGFQVNAPKFERNVSRTSQRGQSAPAYIRTRGHERLAGGADAKSKLGTNATKAEPEATAKVTTEASDSSAVAAAAEEEIEAILGPTDNLESISENKVNEMIDYVIMNLQEAGKTLASLGENFEHDLKLMFVDVMGKLQKWVSLAQLRIEAARNDLKHLQGELVTRSNELAARDREIAEMRKKLTECENSQKFGVDGVGSVDGVDGVAPADVFAMSFVPPRQPLKGETEMQLPAGEASAILGPAGRATSGKSSYPVPSDAASRAQLDAVGRKSADSATHLQGPETSDRSGQPPVGPSQLRLTEGPTTADVAVQSGKGKERNRESQLESEIARLRKENEAIAKERADYENAIQRALLRGVSSLNAETLKVLRCPPPVSGCGRSASPVNAGDDGRATVCRTAQNSSVRCERSKRKEHLNESREGHEEQRGCCSAKRPNTTMHQKSTRCRKFLGSNSQSMAFILQQSADPVACNAPCNVAQNRSWSSAKSKNLEVSTCTRKSG